MKERQIKIGGQIEGIVFGGGAKGCAIISHGAGRGMDTPLLEKTAEELVNMGLIVLRYNFGYIGRKPAPSAGGKNEKPELVAAIEYMKEHGNPILIGKSFGARVGSYVAAERSDIRALVYYGLPLQGMSKTSKPRDWSHLGKIKAPMFFITGDKDKLCPLDVLADVQKHITSKFDSQVVRGDHSFKPKSEDIALNLCVEWVRGLIR